MLMKVIIVGGGNLGEALSRLLIKEKDDVVIIEKDEKLSEKLAEKLDALVLHGDGSDINILRDADFENSDSVVAMTGDDKTNLMICEMAKSVNVPNTISRINEADNESIFAKTGVSNIINTTTTAVLAFKKSLEKPGKHLVNLVGGGKGEVFELSVSKESGFANKLVGKAENGFVISAIYRGGKFIVPKRDMKIKEGDILTICSPLESIKRIEKIM